MASTSGARLKTGMMGPTCCLAPASKASFLELKIVTLLRYSRSLSTFALKLSELLFLRRKSTDIPIERAKKWSKPAASHSSGVNPLPSLTFLLYLIVGHRTTGRSFSTGMGESLLALAMRTLLRRAAWAG